MQFAGKHVSMIGVGITAIASIAAILYYRGRSAAPVSDGGGGGFPYFQTAALPGGGSGNVTVPAAPSEPPTTGPNPTSTGLVQNLSLAGTLSGLLSDFMGQKSALNKADPDPGRSHLWDPLAYTGYINPTSSGGIEFGFGSVQAAAMGPGATIGNNIADLHNGFNARSTNATNSSPGNPVIGGDQFFDPVLIGYDPPVA